MTSLIEHILSLSGWVALLIVFAVPALEASAFLGFVFPGETALILGGVLASYGRVSLWAVFLAGICGAVIGDSVGYLVGREYGARMLQATRFHRLVKPHRVERAQDYLARRGGRAVFFGRFTAACASWSRAWPAWHACLTGFSCPSTWPAVRSGARR